MILIKHLIFDWTFLNVESFSHYLVKGGNKVSWWLSGMRLSGRRKFLLEWLASTVRCFLASEEHFPFLKLKYKTLAKWIFILVENIYISSGMRKLLSPPGIP